MSRNVNYRYLFLLMIYFKNLFEVDVMPYWWISLSYYTINLLKFVLFSLIT